jgi:hypothetical protein
LVLFFKKELLAFVLACHFVSSGAAADVGIVTLAGIPRIALAADGLFTARI